MSSSSTINVHFKGEKEKVPLRKITSLPSKAKYNAPLEGRKSLENVASTHRANNLRNSLSSSKVPIRLESRTGGCSKSNSEVMINENSNKSKGNSKRKIIDHLNSRESHPHGEDKVNAHLSEKKPSRLKRNSAFQINITENISHPRHSRSSSSKAGDEHKKRHGQGRVEPKKVLPSKSILKKFSQSDLHLNNSNLHPVKRKINFDPKKMNNQHGKQTNFKKVTFKTNSTRDLTKSSSHGTGLFLLKKRDEGKLDKHRSPDTEIQSEDHLIQNEPQKIISDSLEKENPIGKNIHNALSNMPEVLNVELEKNNLKQNERNLIEHEDNKNTNEKMFIILSTENIFEVSDDIKLPRRNSPNIKETTDLETDLLYTKNKDQSATQRKVFEKEINEKIKFLTEQYKKNIKFNQKSISKSDNNAEDNKTIDECGDYKIDEPQMNLLYTFENSENTFNISNSNIDNLNIEDDYNAKMLGRKQLLEKEINEKIKILTMKFKENLTKKTFPNMVVNNEEKLKLDEIKYYDEKSIILNSTSCLPDLELNVKQKLIIEEDRGKIHKDFFSDFTSSDNFTKNRVDFDTKEHAFCQKDIESNSPRSQTSTDEIRPKFSRIPRPVTSSFRPSLNQQSNKSTDEKIAKDIVSVSSKQNETGNTKENKSKIFFQDTAFEESPSTIHTRLRSKDLTKSLNCSLIPRPLKSKTVIDSPLADDFQNDTVRKKTSTSPTYEILDGNKIELLSSVNEHELHNEQVRNENKRNHEKYCTVEDFDNLINDKENTEHLNNSETSYFHDLNNIQRKRKNKKDESKKHGIFSSKREENSTKYCDEKDLNVLQIRKNYSNTEVLIPQDNSFYRQFKMFLLLCLMLVLFCFFLFAILFYAYKL